MLTKESIYIMYVPVQLAILVSHTFLADTLSQLGAKYLLGTCLAARATLEFLRLLREASLASVCLRFSERLCDSWLCRASCVCVCVMCVCVCA